MHKTIDFIGLLALFDKSPACFKDRGFLVKLAQNLVQTAKVPCV
jgi:hypothetical protein